MEKIKEEIEKGYKVRSRRSVYFNNKRKETIATFLSQHPCINLLVGSSGLALTIASHRRIIRYVPGYFGKAVAILPIIATSILGELQQGILTQCC